MRIYLDLCCWQRPFDDRSAVRVRSESEAILGIISLFETGDIELISSEILVNEINQCPDDERRDRVEVLVAQMKNTIVLNKQVYDRANQFHAEGIKPVDALHIASAESGAADVFCTCDDRLMKNARKIGNLKLRVLSPLELANEVLP